MLLGELIRITEFGYTASLRDWTWIDQAFVGECGNMAQSLVPSVSVALRAKQK
jgi:hypothetical protein